MGERWFPDEPGLLPPDIQVNVMGREGKRWLVVRPEPRDGVPGYVVIRVVNDNECSDTTAIDNEYRCRHCSQPLQTEHLPGCAWLEDDEATPPVEVPESIAKAKAEDRWRLG